MICCIVGRFNAVSLLPVPRFCDKTVTSRSDSSQQRSQAVQLTGIAVIDLDTKKKFESAQLTECITKQIYPHKKFIIHDDEMALGSKLQKRVCNKLNVTVNHELWWAENKEAVRKKLGRKRNNVQENTRKKMIGEFNVGLLML